MFIHMHTSVYLPMLFQVASGAGKFAVGGAGMITSVLSGGVDALRSNFRRSIDADDAGGRSSGGGAGTDDDKKGGRGSGRRGSGAAYDSSGGGGGSGRAAEKAEKKNGRAGLPPKTGSKGISRAHGSSRWQRQQQQGNDDEDSGGDE